MTNSGANSFNGGIAINAGSVQFGNRGANGNLPANAQPITDNGSLVLNLNSSFSVFGAISGTGNLKQNGSGVVSLAASNSYSGATTMNAGSLMVDGYIGGGGVVSNAVGATIGGTNTIIGTLNASGNISPGDVNGIGTLFVTGNTTLYRGATGMFDLSSSDTTVGNGINDLLAITGNGNVVINGTNGQAGRTYYLLSSTNLLLPRNQWVALATNVLSSANFIFTGTNAVTPGRARQFYILSSTNN